VCHREKSHGVFPSSSSSGTPSGTASGTSSDTASDTASNTKNVGELAVVISTACAGRINDMGFVHPRGLQLLSS
jgi:hypothetical protein